MLLVTTKLIIGMISSMDSTVGSKPLIINKLGSVLHTNNKDLAKLLIIISSTIIKLEFDDHLKVRT